MFLSRWYSSFANYIVSVERIKQYMHIPPQPPAVVADKRPPSMWPPKGRIDMLDLKVRNSNYFSCSVMLNSNSKTEVKTLSEDTLSP